MRSPSGDSFQHQSHVRLLRLETGKMVDYNTLDFVVNSLFFTIFFLLQLFTLNDNSQGIMLNI